MFIDNIFRSYRRIRSIALLGRMPSAVGFNLPLASEMETLQERIASTKNGSITSIQQYKYRLMTLLIRRRNHIQLSRCYLPYSAVKLPLGIYPAGRPL
jgi:hypothetical protein